MPNIVISWTPENVETLRRLHAEGYSPGGIANALGAPNGRNAVMGKLNREGLCLSMTERRKQTWERRKAREAERAEDKEPQSKPATPKITTSDRRYGAPVQQSVAKAKLIAAEQIPDLKQDNRFLTSHVWTSIHNRALLPIEALTPHTCRWPCGDPKEKGFGFCGEHTKQKTDKRGNPAGHYPYCEDHQKIATVPKEITNAKR